VNVPERYHKRGGRFTGPGLDADVDAQAHALVDAAADARAWQALVGVVNAAGAPPERAWALLEDAVGKVTRAAGEDTIVMLLADAADAPEIVVHAPGLEPTDTPLHHVAWVDACPTVIRALDLNVPEGLDGFPVEEAFPEREWSEEDERKVQDHLEKLGYL
jgi:hypothetical protein